jgi:predicted small secreted protein
MKKIFLALAVVFVVTAILSSCHTSRKSGCPMNEKIIRG